MLALINMLVILVPLSQYDCGIISWRDLWVTGYGRQRGAPHCFPLASHVCWGLFSHCLANTWPVSKWFNFAKLIHNNWYLAPYIVVASFWSRTDRGHCRKTGEIRMKKTAPCPCWFLSFDSCTLAKWHVNIWGSRGGV
jgi:hypothetical protein